MCSMKDLQLKSLFHDQTHYTRAFKTYTRLEREFETWAKWVETVFPLEIVDKLATNLSHHRAEPLRIMGVGAGTGTIDCRMMHKLMKRFPRIHNTVVEPTADHIDEFKKLAQSEGFDASDWEWRKKSWEQFMQERGGPEERKFHFINAIHVLYYVDDMEKALLQMVGCLKEGGVLMVVMVTGNSGIARFLRKFPVLTDEKKRNFTSDSVTEVLSKNSIEFKTLHQALSIDIGCCFEEGNPEGDLVVDFITHVPNFSKTAPRELVEEVLAYLGGKDCSFRKDERLFFNRDWEAVVVTKGKTTQ